MEHVNEKYVYLQDYLRSLGSVAVAFSSGVDSTFLLKVSHDVLGERAIAVTAASCSFPRRKLKEAEVFCRQNGIRHIVCQSEELDIEGFRQNPKTAAICASMSCLKRSGQSQGSTALLPWRRAPIWMTTATIARGLLPFESWA